jgi:outer membrane protein TolC
MMLALIVAAVAQPLSLGEVLEGAQRAFPSVVAARSEVVAAEGELQTAQGGFDPSFRARSWLVPISGYPQSRVDAAVEVPTPLWGTSVFAGYRLGLGSIQDYYGERTTWSAGELRAGASIPLLRNGPTDRRRASVGRAELGQHLASQSVVQQRLEVTRLATHRYWEWVAAGRRRDIANALLALATQRDQHLTTRAQAGDVASFEQQDNLRALVQRQGLCVQAERSLAQASFELSLFVRDDEGRSSTLEASRLPSGLPDPDEALVPETELAVALEARPEVQRLSDQVGQYDLELRVLRNQLLPALDFTTTVSQDLGRSPSAKYDSLGKTELEFSLLLEVPLLYNAPLGRITAASAARAKLVAQLGFARERVEVELRDARSALDAARERVRLTRREIELATLLERGEQTRFELGESTLLIVNLREQASAEARLREVDALVEFHKALASLKAAASR